jgi:hypothetical protein
MKRITEQWGDCDEKRAEMKPKVGEKFEKNAKITKQMGNVR